MSDLRVETIEGFGLVTIMARRGVDVAAIGAALEVAAPPERPGWVGGADGIMLIGIGAGNWHAWHDAPPPGWADALRDRLGSLASVSDQSDGYLVTRLSGEDARTVLQRGAAIDFHPDAFSPGCAATTMIAHIGTIIWQRDAAPTYDVATFRSYADSFRHWLGQTAAAL